MEKRLLELMEDKSYKLSTAQDLEAILQITDADGFKELVRTLVLLEDTGDVSRSRNNKYGLSKKMGYVRGRLAGNARGFAFLIPDEEGLADVYISALGLNGAMHGDIVLVQVMNDLFSELPRKEGTVTKIIKRGLTEFVGTYEDMQIVGAVVPDDKKITMDIFISKEARNGAMAGHKVVVKITDYPNVKRDSAMGEVIAILGHKNDPGVDILSIIHKHGLPTEFPQEVLQAASEVPEIIAEEDLVNRHDLRSEMIVTIDGEDAKDLDDAVTVTKLANGNYKLGVHIADVSHYVTEGSAIDKEAYERGTSTYLVDRVIPMIPHRLSNGICSLNPQADRLTLSCEMEVDTDGEVVSHEIFQSVIHTTERMTYTDVNKILVEQDADLLEKYAKLTPMFQDMAELARILRRKRMSRGAIDFDSKEAKVLVNEDGHPYDVLLRERSVAERLIEEFMLLANETVAEHIHWLKLPFIYRVHEDPKPEKLQRFLEFITNFGYTVKGTKNDIHPRALQEILALVKGKPEETVISTVLLRSMKQAKYDIESLGHYGLSTDFYTHFTSPIRRYPDLIVHRLLRTYVINGQVDSLTQEKWTNDLPDIAEHTSSMERRAVEAERETDSLKKAEYMLDKLGEEFTGIISSVTNFGLFVELPNTIEGLVHVNNLWDDYYNYNESQYAMIGEHTGKVYRIGDSVTVRVAKVSKEDRAIDFTIVKSQGQERTAKEAPKVVEGSRGRRKQTPLNDAHKKVATRGRTSGSGTSNSRTTKSGSGKSGTTSGKAVTPGKKREKKFFEGVPNLKKKRKKK